ncbi:MAG TPA: D-glycero-beta-D-manno-heptose-1,7-bisphosphate 7-phosphatase [Spongiibacteraceae bacterium]|nr:D-glycero-beta-D-manno-heptose-1,7-bisphosphate 7-phosphatase [Spongiibacteraceae bacterium]HCS26156.1 D-glycero-beta-D-manno-heptose-1,7-bisphosphate 7-phosphatase [Spongiibacteraceae bacterium]|tara:strand:+ start:1646 stop:2203 length:558 start_codon:yes stop_codon:yes gene_type:complete
MSLILLDRDGVINEDSDNYIRSADEWQPIPGSIEAIARLSQAGYRVAVCTNQSGLGRGYFTRSDLDAMHRKMLALVEQAGGSIAGIYYCPHLPDENCDCRKPLPGLIDQAAADLGLNAAGAAFVGDSLKDLQAAHARDCLPVLVKTGKGEKTFTALSEHSSLSHTRVFDNLAAFVNWFIKDRTSQ